MRHSGRPDRWSPSGHLLRGLSWPIQNKGSWHASKLHFPILFYIGNSWKNKTITTQIIESCKYDVTATYVEMPYPM